MKLVDIHKKLFAVPDCWNELTGPQLVQVMEVFENPGELDEARLKLLQIITGMKRWRMKLVPPAALMDVIYLGDFIITENTLTKNLLPQYKSFYGPADDFGNLLMCEFTYAEDYFLRWKQGEEKDESLLNALVAVLYRKAKKNYDKKKNEEGDVREKFNEHVCNYHAKHTVKNWPLQTRKAITHWYDGCRSKLSKDYPDVFSGSGGEPAKYGLVSMMLNVAEKGTFGDFDKVEQKPVRLVMVQLDEMVQEAKKMEQQMKNVK